MTGWRKRQIALDVMAENARELGLDYEPNTITFLSEPATEILRLSVDGIWANPDIPSDDAAKLVLEAIDDNIKILVQKAVLAEREAIIQMMPGGYSVDPQWVCDMIRARKQA
jgi:hypothetical protein